MPSTPKNPPAKSGQVISRQLRGMILTRGGSVSEPGREAGIDPAIIQRFLNEERDIRLDSLDRLADVLGLRLIEGARGRSRPTPPPRSPRPRAKSRTAEGLATDSAGTTGPDQPTADAPAE